MPAAREPSTMSDHPTGQTIDGTPWEEPRPPHLPDAATRLSPWVFPFVLLAALQVIAGWLEWKAQGDLGDPSYGLSIALGVVQTACVSLLGAALFLRHPDAHRRLPMLVFGVALLVATVLLPLVVKVLDVPLRTDESTFILAIYDYGINVVSALGLIYLARGLDRARRRSDVVSGRGLGIVLTALVVLAAVVTALPWFASGPELLTPGNVVALILSFFVTLAWCYLLVTANRGWRAGERPLVGWLLVVVAAGTSIAVRLLISVSGSLDMSQIGPIVLWVISAAFVSVWVLLLLAFLIGLPSTVAEPDPAASDQLTGDGTDADLVAMGDRPGATRSGSGAG
jgi:hypothetical protein